MSLISTLHYPLCFKDQIHPDVFKVQGQILERCTEVPQISLNPWYECQDDDPPNVSRVKRDTTPISFDEEDPSGERVEGLEMIMLKNKREFQKMQRQMLRMHRTIVQMKNNSAIHEEKSVCVDFDGSIRSNMELWKHSHSGSCVSCLCKVCM